MEVLGSSKAHSTAPRHLRHPRAPELSPDSNCSRSEFTCHLAMDEVTDQQTAGSINQTKKTSWFGNIAKNPFIFGVALVRIPSLCCSSYHNYTCFLTNGIPGTSFQPSVASSLAMIRGLFRESSRWSPLVQSSLASIMIAALKDGLCQRYFWVSYIHRG
ncbi:hypothetical protein H107_03613 [Trichophyton rubrum CBS 202.88]|nr:hypothetical protein H110_03504 [Trichophyton rubrum MR1448]EZG17787.1 hypothetical protein H107_03613 [Trichophyton rubrum CBS 202.88]